MQDWLRMLHATNERHIGPQHDTIVHVFTDVSQSGGGMVTSRDWCYVDWSIDVPELNNSHINVKETAAVAAAVYCWAPNWSGKNAITLTGNTSTRAFINRGR